MSLSNIYTIVHEIYISFISKSYSNNLLVLFVFNVIYINNTFLVSY